MFLSKIVIVCTSILPHSTAWLKKCLQCIIVSSVLAFSTAQAELNLELPELELPDMGDPSRAILSRSQEKSLGRKLFRELRRSLTIIEDPELIHWIRGIGNRLLLNAPSTGNPFYFCIVADEAINAFAMPGGVVAINSGLILNSESESELAAVVAHEIAHVTQRHIARMQANSNHDGLALGLGILAAMAASAYDPQLGQAAIMSTVALQAHKQLSFSRQAEAEADRVGLKILAASRYDPMGMSIFLDKLDRHNLGENEDLTKYLRSHPLTIERVGDVRTRAAQYKNRHIDENSEYYYAREKLRAVLGTATNYVGSEAMDLSLQRYTKAWQLSKNQHWSDAIDMLSTTEARQHLPSALSLAQWLNEQQRYEETQQLLNPLLSLYPAHEAIVSLLAEAQLALKQVRSAWQNIQSVTITEQTSLGFFELTARVAQTLGEKTQAYQALVARQMRLGEYEAAIALLEGVLEQESWSTVEESRLRGLLAEVKSVSERNKVSLIGE